MLAQSTLQQLLEAALDVLLRKGVGYGDSDRVRGEGDRDHSLAAQQEIQIATLYLYYEHYFLPQPRSAARQ